MSISIWFTSPAGWLPRTGISSRTLCSLIGLRFHLFTVLDYPVLVKNLPLVVIFQPSTILCKSCGTCTCRIARLHRSNKVPRCGLLLQIYRGLYVCWAKLWAVLKRMNQSRCHLDLGLPMEPCISIRWRPEYTMERGNFGASPGWLCSIGKRRLTVWASHSLGGSSDAACRSQYLKPPGPPGISRPTAASSSTCYLPSILIS